MKFVTERRHQPQQENVSGDGFTHFLLGLGSAGIGLAKFGQVCPGMERVRSGFTCYPMACGDMTGVTVVKRLQMVASGGEGPTMRYGMLSNSLCEYLLPSLPRGG